MIGKYTFSGFIMLLAPITTQLIAGLREIHRETSELKELLAMRRRDRVCREIKYELAALRFRTALIRYADLSQKAGFRRDQPRWPAGTAEGGQWSGGAGAESPSTEPSANPKSSGHHLVPGELYRNEPLQPETRKVFEQTTTGPIGGEPHGYSSDHVQYNDAVIDAFERFKTENGINRSEDVTPEQAKRFVDEVRSSTDPRIRNFNMKILRQQFRYFMRRGPRGTE
jgi:hypothetical protein